MNGKGKGVAIVLKDNRRLPDKSHHITTNAANTAPTPIVPVSLSNTSTHSQSTLYARNNIYAEPSIFKSRFNSKTVPYNTKTIQVIGSFI